MYCPLGSPIDDICHFNVRASHLYLEKMKLHFLYFEWVDPFRIAD